MARSLGVPVDIAAIVLEHLDAMGVTVPDAERRVWTLSDMVAIGGWYVSLTVRQYCADTA